MNININCGHTLIEIIVIMTFLLSKSLILTSEQVRAGGDTQAVAAPQGRNKYFIDKIINLIKYNFVCRA